MRELLRRSPKFFAIVLLAGVGLRLLFVFVNPSVTDDSRIYADIAKNWLQHGIYGITDAGQVIPTYIRLPGYPAFLALVFAVFGLDNFRAVLLWQVFIDLGTCFLIADMVRRTMSPRAARVAFVLAALCPFLANYAAAALSETLEIFFTALALDLAIVGLEGISAGSLRQWIWCGLAIAAGIYLRPDGGLLLVGIAGYLAYYFVRWFRVRNMRARIFWVSILLASFSLVPLAPWTLRNMRTMHRFEPLTPRYANAPDEFFPLGFNRWVKTWIADYASVEEVYWQEPGAQIDPAKLASRAFDSPNQRQRTLELLDAYNQTLEINPELDGQFAALAQTRIHENPFRYYVWLPALRIADMWMRPRTELLPSDVRWWEFNDDLRGSALAVGFGVINLFYIVGAIVGVWRVPPIRWLGMLVLYVSIRSMFLGTLENPEPRYTLECYPVVIALATGIFRIKNNYSDQ
ncbi:MAG TPA: glycosyltransferase family 39 protein [Terriglobales bacterium]|nr:glycosyltransferase family 39 protein [Terriglobales bacterium]